MSSRRGGRGASLPRRRDPRDDQAVAEQGREEDRDQDDAVAQDAVAAVPGSSITSSAPRRLLRGERIASADP
jgi:hypothetical protein